MCRGSEVNRPFEVQVHDTAMVNGFVVQNYTFSDNGIGASFTQDTSGTLTFKLLNNTMTNPEAGIASQIVPACVLTMFEPPGRGVRRRPIAIRSSHPAARARRRRDFAPIGGNKCASSRRKCANRGSPRRLYVLLRFTKQTHFGYIPSSPGDFHVHGQGRRNVSLGVASSLEALEFVQGLVETSLYWGLIAGELGECVRLV